MHGAPWVKKKVIYKVIADRGGHASLLLSAVSAASPIRFPVGIFSDNRDFPNIF